MGVIDVDHYLKQSRVEKKANESRGANRIYYAQKRTEKDICQRTKEVDKGDIKCPRKSNGLPTKYAREINENSSYSQLDVTIGRSKKASRRIMKKF